MIVRPKVFTMLEILNWKFLITLDPRQKWECDVSEGKYRIKRDNVALNFSKAEFEKHFKVVGKEQK